MAIIGYSMPPECLPDFYHVEIPWMAGSSPFKIESIDTYECHCDITASIRCQRVVTCRRDLYAHSFFKANTAHLSASLHSYSKKCHSENNF